MKNWKDAPNLFANGKFSCKWNTKTWLIEGYYNSRFGFVNLGNQMIWKHIDDCNLIARPISDMTDEEKIEYNQWLSYDDYGCPYQSVESFLYALSIGVYPFDESHFKPQITEFQNGEKHVNPASVINIVEL